MSILVTGFMMAFSDFHASAYSNSDYNLQNEELWNNFLKYDLQIYDYDSLTKEKQELCKYVFETEINSEYDIVCERARRIIEGYDVGERISAEKLTQYEFIGDYGKYYNYSLPSGNSFYAPYSDILIYHCVPDIRYVGQENYNEYWMDEKGDERIITTGDAFESFGENEVLYDPMYFYCKYEDGEKTESSHNYFEKISCPDISSDDIDYIVYPDNTLALKSVNTSSEKVIIPDMVENMPVTRIKADAFEKSHITELVLPDSIKYIEPFAFRNCNELTKVNIPQNVEFIGCNAFESCTALKELELNCPEAYISKTELFKNCNITDLFINMKSVPYFKDGIIDNIIFGNDVNAVEQHYLNGKNEIPDNVKISFADNRYSGDDMNSVIVPQSIKIFGAYPQIENADIFSEINHFAYIPLLDEKYCVVNKDCKIYGYFETDAEYYANKYNLCFCPLNSEIKGDANCDGELSMADAVLIMQSLANPAKYGIEGTNENHITEQGKKNADIAGENDGITNADALAIQKKLLKLD